MTPTSSMLIPTLTTDRLKIHAMCKKNSPSYLFAEGLCKELPRSYTRVATVTFNNGLCNLASSAFKVNNDPEKYDHKERRTLLKFYTTKGSSPSHSFTRWFWRIDYCCYLQTFMVTCMTQTQVATMNIFNKSFALGDPGCRTVLLALKETNSSLIHPRSLIRSHVWTSHCRTC